jgi:hypothetical protein
LQDLFRSFHQQPPRQISHIVDGSCRSRSGGCE